GDVAYTLGDERSGSWFSENRGSVGIGGGEPLAVRAERLDKMGSTVHGPKLAVIAATKVGVLADASEVLAALDRITRSSGLVLDDAADLPVAQSLAEEAVVSMKERKLVQVVSDEDMTDVEFRRPPQHTYVVGIGDDISMLWGPSEFDVRHIFVANYLYQLPFLHGHNGFLGKALGDWQISGIVQYQTGTPCNAIQSGQDFAGVGQDANFGCGNNGQFWAMNGTPHLVKTFGPNGQWLSTTNPDGSPIFTKPAAGTFVTQRVRDVLYQPGLENWNMGLFK